MCHNLSGFLGYGDETGSNEKKTPWPLVRKRTIPTERPPLVDETLKKVNLSQCLTKHFTVKTYRGVDVQIHVFLTSAAVGGEWSASRPGRVIPAYPLDTSLGGPRSRC
jgi:hypothetical protein